MAWLRMSALWSAMFTLIGLKNTFSLTLLKTLWLSSTEDRVSSAESFSGRTDPLITTTIRNPSPQTEEADMLVRRFLNYGPSRYLKTLAGAFHRLVLPFINAHSPYAVCVSEFQAGRWSDDPDFEFVPIKL